MRRRRGFQAAIVLAASAAVLTGCDGANLGSHKIDVSADPARVGERVDFTARAETFEDYKLRNEADFQPEALLFKWDLDGDGTFETRSNTEISNPTIEGLGDAFSSRISRTYAAPATIRVSSLISISPDFGAIGGWLFGDVSSVSRPLTVQAAPSGGSNGPPVTDQPPLASFTATPNPAEPHQQIQFDASGSSDADGSIVKYEWEIDTVGNNFERDTGANPRTSTFYDNSGTYRVGLRVTDDDGLTATTTRDVIVRFAPRTGRTALRAGAGETFSLEPDGREVHEGVYSLNGDEIIFSRAKSKGTLPAGPFPKALRGRHDVRWAADYVVTANAETGEGRAEAFILLTFATGGRACLGTTVTGIGTDDPVGSFSVLGGIGRAARLRGTGTVKTELDADDQPILNGTGRFRLADSPDFGLGKSKCGPLRRLAPQRD